MGSGAALAYSVNRRVSIATVKRHPTRRYACLVHELRSVASRRDRCVAHLRQLETCLAPVMRFINVLDNAVDRLVGHPVGRRNLTQTFMLDASGDIWPRCGIDAVPMRLMGRNLGRLYNGEARGNLWLCLWRIHVMRRIKLAQPILFD
jgi:hypothetical protein